MSDNQKLVVTERTEFGKGAARKIRAKDMIPAVLYGHGTEPRHLTLPGHETMLLVRQSNAIVELEVEGGENAIALVKDVQRDPVRQVIEHVDLVIVKRGERVEVEVPVQLEGEPFPGMQAMQDTTAVLVSAEAMHIPDAITVSVEGLEEGTVIHATDVKLPQGVKLVDEETEIILVTIQAPQKQDLGDESVQEAQAEESDAEDKKDDEDGE
ncbi:50S ribosomal protein L25/general stress protein Ctc [Pseudoclavibacter alba]|uniref:Large ribosomal subunit protein bL25 n=1 Tax=Pseudoclavibacter albus TaxID=272241 RepID=A0ABT2HWS3_9MICO|nr:50S ribosomal protein L25/general stress protein Ctc [Pseudoclavibacter alba]MCT2042767.1 50S ribosomal protein L25/general stress protein Ctc [Pseudoclavibacter alba]